RDHPRSQHEADRRAELPRAPGVASDRAFAARDRSHLAHSRRYAASETRWRDRDHVEIRADRRGIDCRGTPGADRRGTGRMTTAAAPGNVLVVDDDDAGRYVKRRILEQAGHSVTEAREGFEALRIIVGTKPEVVVLDVKLPDIKGTELCRKLRDNGVGVCVLMTSAAFVDPADRVASLESGADAYLIEPFDPTELVAAVSSLLRMARAEQSLRVTNAAL